MSAKLVVRKYETGSNFKTLQIYFEDVDNGSSLTRYSEWSKGRAQMKVNEPERSSRLVVKIASGIGNKNFNLDSCATVINSPASYISKTFNSNTSNDNKFKLSCEEICTTESTSFNAAYKSYKNNHYDIYDSSSFETSMCPLEYSLEKVKKNNARIMENIHLLNQTLSYTKKKEILDIVCQKSTRYPCTSCGKFFVYETGLKRHYAMRHALIQVQPRWQTVWTCIECFQVWPRQDLATKHSNECCKSGIKECIREIKTSLLLQCEFCEKVYTSIPRLLRHSKVHHTANNYECNACNTAFLSYKAAEQHWVLCPWLKLCYNFSLPKMLLCNACDRKFRNYEQLYNHRYKVGHFMTKTHSTRNGAKSLGILVYQCEICAEWFPAIPSLQAHKGQHHPHYAAETRDWNAV